MFRTSIVAALIALAALAGTAPAQPKDAKDNFTRTDDVVYARKFGTALTMDVFTPKENANGKGVVWCVSGGWVSGKPAGPGLAKEYIDRGYVVFAVTHGSAPKYAVPEVIEDMHRAVKFIKFSAKRFNVDPDKLGISGASAGGHLSLMLGNAPREGNEKSPDPVERQSSKVAAVACFFPPTDFLNYGKEAAGADGDGILKAFRAPFDFHELKVTDGRPHFVPVTDPDKRRDIFKAISPATHVSKTSAPALIVHGDADKLVPIQQAELLAPKYKAAGVPFELVVKKDADHGWKGIDQDVKTLADWFDNHLLGKK